jgi:aminoglycoside 6'-N-acetyltransferase Ib
MAGRLPAGLSAPITFRLITVDDLPMLHEWLGRPHVAKWWAPRPSLDDMADEFEPFMDATGRFQGYIALEGSREIGYIQSYVVKDCGDGWWEDEQDPGARGIDQFLAHADQLGRGLGTAMIRAFITRLFENLTVTHIQTDPDPGNARAIRCYEKVGFRALKDVDTPGGRALLMICDRTALG